MSTGLDVVKILIGLIALITLDVSYLSTVKDTVYAPLMAAGGGEISVVPALLSWMLIYLGVGVLAVRGSESVLGAAALGAVFGFTAYGIYNTTNLATWRGLRDQPGAYTMAVADTVWGTTVCALSAAALKLLL